MHAALLQACATAAAAACRRHAHTWTRLCLQMARGEATRRRKRNQEKAALLKGEVRVQKPLLSV